MLSGVVRVGLIDKAPCEQRLEGGEGMGPMGVWETSVWQNESQCKGPEAEHAVCVRTAGRPVPGAGSQAQRREVGRGVLLALVRTLLCDVSLQRALNRQGGGRTR